MKSLRYLCTLLLLTILGVGGVNSVFAGTTYKLQKVTSVETGGLYVFEQSGYVMTTVSSKVLQITKTYNKTGLNGSEKYVFALESATASNGATGFKMKNMSLSSNEYIGNSSSKTDMTACGSGSAAVWAFNFQNDGTVLIQNLNNNNRFLGLNQKIENGPTGYKAYAANNMESNPHAIVVYKLVEESSLSDAGLAYETTSYAATLGESFTAPTLTNPHNLLVTYASSNTDVATVASDGSITLVGAGTTTIIASFAGNDTYAAGEASYTLTVVDPNAPGTENNPYTVAQALENTPASGNSAEVYVKGIVSGFYGTNTNILTDNSHRYYISDDGTATDQLLVYNGKGLNNVAFSNAEDVLVGDVVVIKGQLTTYQGTKEFAKDNYIVSLTRKEKVDADLAYATTEITAVRGDAFIAPTLTNPYNVPIVYTSSDRSVATVAEDGTVTLLKAGTTTITAAFAGNNDYKAGEASYTLTVTVPSHAATFFVNGQQKGEPATVAEDEAITFPAVAEEILGKKFVGWSTAAIDGETDDTPATLVNAATMGNADVTYYAVFANKEGTFESASITINAGTEGVPSSYGTAKTFVEYTLAGKKFQIQQMYKNGEKLQWRAAGNSNGTGTMYNSEAIESIQSIVLVYTSDDNNKNFSVKVGSEENPTDGTQITATTDGSTQTFDCAAQNCDYFVLTNGSGAGYLTSLTINYLVGSVIFSGYCTMLTLAAPTFSVAAGEVEKGTEVTITAEEGATLKYTVGEATTTTESNTATVTVNEDVTIKAVAVKDGVESEEVSATYTVKVEEPVALTAPIIFHDGGEYETALTVAMAGEGTIKYTLNDGVEQIYSAPITINETTTVKAWAEVDDAKSDVVTKTFTINNVEKPEINLSGYYSIKGADGKYVNVAGRKTVNFVDDNTDKAGTVIKLETENAQVKVLRSQGVDIPGYAEKAMRYVPKIVKLVADKLNAEGSGKILGENGLDAIMAKFDEAFDEHLYLEQVGEGYRIYGKTPSMKHVVDFYAENKANVDAKLPMLEQFINDAIQKVLNKTNGSGASILVPFSLETVWTNMGGTLTKPIDEASTARFYEEVLSSEENVWNFAYETAMIYWTKLKDHPKFKENLGKLGDYAKYINKVENICPNFKYYIVLKNGKMDIISEGDEDILNDNANAIWTLEDRTDFSVTFNEENVLNNKYYTTLYTDFAYTLPEGVKAYKVTSIDESGCFGHATTEEICSQSIAAQTPVLLVSENAGNQNLILTETGIAVEGNLLVGSDYLINKYQIKTAQVESLFDMAKGLLGEEGYNTYLKEYEHLMLRNAGTVNNKYFFGLSKDDCKNLDENVCLLDNTEEAGLVFANGWETMGVNKAFLTSDIYTEIRLAQVGDVDRNGVVSVGDVKALVEIVLGKVTEENNPNKYDFGAADVNCDSKITIADVTSLVNIILKKTQN